MSDDILNNIHSKVEKISEDVAEIKIVAARQEEITKAIKDDLKYHIKRTNLLENLYKDIDLNRIQPIEKDLNQFKGFFKVLGFIGAALGVLWPIIYYIIKK